MDYVLCIAALATWENYTTSCATYKCGELAQLLTSIISSHHDATIPSPSVASPPDMDALHAVIDLAKDTLDKLPAGSAASIAESEAGRIHFRGSS